MEGGREGGRGRGWEGGRGRSEGMEGGREEGEKIKFGNFTTISGSSDYQNVCRF